MASRDVVLKCGLSGFRQLGPSAADGCPMLDLSVPNAHYGEPFHKAPGLTATDCIALAPHLRNATALRKLRIRGLSGIHHTHEQPGIRSAGMQAIAAALPPNLEVLDISGNEIGNEGTQSLATAFAARPVRKLRELNLALNSITDEGAVALEGIFRVLPALEKVTLDHNWIGAAGGEALARALHDGVTVRQLSMASNNLAERGGVALANALGANRNLQALNLYSNSLGTRGAVAFAAMLARGTSALADINLSHNYIDADGESTGAMALSDAIMRNNPTLRKLDLRWNHFALCHCGSPARLRRAARGASRLELVMERREA